MNGCRIWPLTLQEGHWLRALMNKLLRKVFGPTYWRRYIMKNIIISTLQLILRMYFMKYRYGDPVGVGKPRER